MASKIRTFDPFASQAHPVYSNAVSVVSGTSKTVHIAGQLGRTRSGLVPSAYVSQIHLALFNLRAALISAGAGVKNIVKLTYYIVNYDPAAPLHLKHIQKFLDGHRPATTLVPVPQLARPEYLFEIEAVAVVPEAPAVGPLLTGAGQEVDVVVVGAGLSGLQAAVDVKNAGLSCVVLEARDRVGGKTWTRPLAGGKGLVDVGAAWINDTNQSHMIALARQFGLTLVVQNIIGDIVFHGFDGDTHTFPYGSVPNLVEDEKEDMIRIRDFTEEICHTIDTFDPKSPELDSLTFEDYLRQQGARPKSLATAAIWTRAMLGVEPSEISALYFLNYCKSGGGLMQMRSDGKHGGQYLRIREGCQSFSFGLAASLSPGSVKLSSPVTAIDQTAGDSSVVVGTDTGIYRARSVIVSVPTPVYKTIAFSPPLPFEKTLLSDSTRYGYYSKMIVVFASPFWRPKGLCGMAQSFAGPAGVIRDTSTDVDGKYNLTCFIGGDHGIAWSLLPLHERQEQILNQIAHLYADRETVDKELLEVMEMEWCKEKWSGWGCPCPSMPPGVLDASGETLRAPVGNVHFVGTETAGEWKGYMEGAVRSGKRGAAEVITALKSESARL